MNEHLARFEKQLPDLIFAWSRALRAGYSVRQILEGTAQMQTNKRPFDPEKPCDLIELLETSNQEDVAVTAGEFQQVMAETQSGVSLLQALDNLQLRLPGDNLNLILSTMKAQREVGGNLADILEILSHVLRERGGSIQ